MRQGLGLYPDWPRTHAAQAGLELLVHLLIESSSAGFTDIRHHTTIFLLTVIFTTFSSCSRNVIILGSWWPASVPHSSALPGIQGVKPNAWLILYPCNGLNVAASSYGSQIFSIGFIYIENISRMTELRRPSTNRYTVRVAIPSL